VMSIAFPSVRTLRTLAIFLALLLLITSLASGRMPARLVSVAPLAVVAVIGLAVVATRLEVGVALLPAVGALVPFSIGTGTKSPIVAALLYAVFLAAVWLTRGFLAKKLALVDLPINAPSIALLTVWIISYLYSDVSRDPLVWNWNDIALPRLGQLGIVLISGVILLIAANSCRDQHVLPVATWSTIGCGILAVGAFYTRHESAIWFLNSGGLFTMWGISLSYGQALFNQRLSKWVRLGLLAFVALWLYKAMILQTSWFSGWLPSLVALLVITFFRSRRAFLLLIVAGAAAVSLRYDAVYHALWTTKVDSGDLTRLDIWAQALDLFHRHPILGTGPAGYAAYFQSLYLNSAFSLSTHSNYVDVLIETGLIGTMIFIWLLVAMLVAGWRARSTWLDGFAGGYAQGAFGGLVGALVAMQLGDWVIPFVYNQTIAGFRFTVHTWVFVGFLAGLAVLSPKRERMPWS
jgi:O-antigen ligase